MVHHKAPHREWEPYVKHADMYENEEILEPETFYDDYENRSSAAAAAKMRMEDLKPKDLKQEVPAGLSPKDEKRWRYQRYIKDYLRVVASVDDNVGRVLDYLEDEGLVDNTLVIYTSDQGFFLGDHGWFDKRFMYEESLRMPFVLRLPREVKAGTKCDDFVLNVDFASLVLDLAGVTIPDEFQGHSFRSLLHGETPQDWRQSMYYRYWMHGDGAHNVYAHYGVRTHDYKLIYFYNDGCGQAGTGSETHPPEWGLFDRKVDPYKLKSVVDEASEKPVRDELTDELHRLQDEVGDRRYHLDV
jgi:arylsulfatase A-like enzyme